MQLRNAKKTDLDDVLNLFENTVERICIGDYTIPQVEAWLSLVQKRREVWSEKLESQYFILAERGETLVGFGSLDKGTYIDFMYTHYQYQGKGVASGIYRALEEEALRLESTVLQSDVSITARPFFEYLGFKVIRKNENHIKGENLINYRMEKSLRQA